MSKSQADDMDVDIPDYRNDNPEGPLNLAVLNQPTQALLDSLQTNIAADQLATRKELSTLVNDYHIALLEQVRVCLARRRTAILEAAEAQDKRDLEDTMRAMHRGMAHNRTAAKLCTTNESGPPDKLQHGALQVVAAHYQTHVRRMAKARARRVLKLEDTEVKDNVEDLGAAVDEGAAEHNEKRDKARTARARAERGHGGFEVMSIENVVKTAIMYMEEREKVIRTQDQVAGTSSP